MNYKLIITNEKGEEQISGGPAQAVLMGVLTKIGKPDNSPAMFQLQSLHQCFISETADPQPLVALVATAYMGIEMVRNHIRSIEGVSYNAEAYQAAYDALDKLVVEVTKAVSGANEVKFNSITEFVDSPDFQNLKKEMGDKKLMNRLKGRTNGNNAPE